MSRKDFGCSIDDGVANDFGLEKNLEAGHCKSGRKWNIAP